MRPRRRARAARPTPTPTPTPTPSSRDDDRPPPAASSSSFASLPTSLARRFVALAAWKRFALITLVVAGPYALYVSYLWIRLQSGLLRAPVRVATPRAVLIVGTQSSGTTQMSAELGKIGLEVAHETSDAQWEFARDGTISWLHALRFMPGRADLAFTTAFCSRFRRSMGFHPAMFGPPELGCSYRKTWDDCWRMQCGVIARRVGVRQERELRDAVRDVAAAAPASASDDGEPRGEVLRTRRHGRLRSLSAESPREVRLVPIRPRSRGARRSLRTTSLTAFRAIPFARRAPSVEDFFFFVVIVCSFSTTRTATSSNPIAR